MRGTQELEPRSRILTLMALVLCAYLVLLGRLAYWQVWRHSDMARLAATYHDDTITLAAARGNILDRNGALLVTNTPVYSIFASPDQITGAERNDIAAKLAPVLQLTTADIEVKLASARQFVYLARRVPASVAQQLDAMRLPGIGKVAETQRSYVDGGVAGTVQYLPATIYLTGVACPNTTTCEAVGFTVPSSSPPSAEQAVVADTEGIDSNPMIASKRRCGRQSSRPLWKISRRVSARSSSFAT